MEDNFRTRVKQDLIKNKVIVEHRVCASFSNELLCSEDEHPAKAEVSLKTLGSGSIIKVREITDE